MHHHHQRFNLLVTQVRVRESPLVLNCLGLTLPSPDSTDSGPSRENQTSYNPNLAIYAKNITLNEESVSFCFNQPSFSYNENQTPKLKRNRLHFLDPILNAYLNVYKTKHHKRSICTHFLPTDKYPDKPVTCRHRRRRITRSARDNHTSVQSELTRQFSRPNVTSSQLCVCTLQCVQGSERKRQRDIQWQTGRAKEGRRKTRKTEK